MRSRLLPQQRPLKPSCVNLGRNAALVVSVVGQVRLCVHGCQGRTRQQRKEGDMMRRLLLTAAFAAGAALAIKALAHPSDWVCASEIAPCPESHPLRHVSQPWAWCSTAEGDDHLERETLTPKWTNIGSAITRWNIGTSSATSTTAGIFLFADKERDLLFVESTVECGRLE